MNNDREPDPEIIRQLHRIDNVEYQIVSGSIYTEFYNIPGMLLLGHSEGIYPIMCIKYDKS